MYIDEASWPHNRQHGMAASRVAVERCRNRQGFGETGYNRAAMDIRPLPFRRNHVLQLMLMWLLVLWLITAIDPVNRRDWLLENLLVFSFGALLLVSYRWFAFSNLAYLLFTVFLSLHLVGAHYTYSATPPGLWLQDGLELTRNPYDRIVHFSFGLLIAHPFRELLMRAAGARRYWACLLAVMMVLAFSAFYETLEALVAMRVDPDLGIAFVGAQGDIWDAQKDTLLAFLGAVIAIILSCLLMPPLGDSK